jgi:hypothetical protein
MAAAALQHACCPSCSVVYFITDTSGIDKAPAEPSAGALWVRVAATHAEY